MPSTFDASNLATSGPATSIQVTITPSAIGNLLGLIIRFNSATATVSSVSDDRGNTWNPATTLIRSNNASGILYYAIAGSTSITTITVNFSASASCTIAVDSIVPSFTPSLAQTNQASGNSGNPNSGSITTSATAILIAGVAVSPNSDAFTAGTGWNERQPGGTGQRCYIADQLDVAAGTYSGDASISTQDWSAHIAAFVASGISSSAIGRVGLRGANDATVTHTSSAVGRVGLRGTNDKAVAGSNVVGRVGLRGTNASTSTHTTDAIGRVGLRGTDDATVTHTTSAVGRVGLRGANTRAVAATSCIGRVGLRSQNVSQKIVQDFVVGGVGVRGTNSQLVTGSSVVGRVGLRGTNSVTITHTTDAVGRVGLRGTNLQGQQASNVVGRVGLRGACASTRSTTFTTVGRVGPRSQNSVAPPVAQSQGRVGVRGTNASNASHTTDAVGRVGLRCNNSFTHSSTVPTNVGRVGLRSLCTSTRFITSSTVGRAGPRAVNVWVQGIAPTPEAPPVVNASDCEPDWNLAEVVVWVA